MENEVVLLNLFLSPFGARVRIALAEKGIDYELREEDVFNKSPLLLEMNPVHKLVPVLIHKGRPLCESLIILEYIDEVWNHKPALLPSDPYERAHARFWANFVDKIFNNGPPVWLSWTSSNDEVKEKTRNELIKNFKVLEGELGDKLYFGGDSFGFVDLSAIPLYTLFYTFETLGNFSMAAECPKIMAWANRCLQKESVSKSLADQHKAYQFVLGAVKKLRGE